MNERQAFWDAVFASAVAGAATADHYAGPTSCAQTAERAKRIADLALITRDAMTGPAGVPLAEARAAGRVRKAQESGA